MARGTTICRKFGMRYIAAFPIRIAGKVAGSFQVYAPQANFFNENEVSLLTQVSDDVSFALTAISDLTARKQAEEALRRSEHNLTNFFNQAPVGLVWLSARRRHPARQPGATGSARLPGGGIPGTLLHRVLRGSRRGPGVVGVAGGQEDGPQFSHGSAVQGRHDPAYAGGRHLVLERRRSSSIPPFFCATSPTASNWKRKSLQASERESPAHRPGFARRAGPASGGHGCTWPALCKRTSPPSPVPEARQLDRDLKADQRGHRADAQPLPRPASGGTGKQRPDGGAGVAGRANQIPVPNQMPFHLPAAGLDRDNTVATHLFRIAQEAVTNAIKHGKPGASRSA